VQHDVVGDHERSGLEFLAGETEQLLVLLVGRVEEDHVEHVVDRGQRLARVAFDQLGRLLEAGVGDVAPPAGDAFVVALELEDPAAEEANRGREPDRGVAAAGADLEHLAIRLRRADGEEKSSGRRLDRNAGRPLLLRFEPLENAADAIVEHQLTSTLTIPSSTRTGNVSTGKTAGSVNGLPVRMSIWAP